MENKKAIIIGASSGIGRQLAKIMSANGYTLGITARRMELLESLQSELPAKTHIKYMDISDPTAARAALDELTDEMGGVDTVIVSAGTGFVNPELAWEKERDTIDTNVSGVTAVINTAMHNFIQKKSGHLVAISSIAGLYGISGDAPAYGATKAYLSNYLQALRHKVKTEKLQIAVTDIRPGFVDTDMAKGEGLFWVMPVEKVCRQIYKAIKKKKKTVVVTKRWKPVAFILKRMR